MQVQGEFGLTLTEDGFLATAFMVTANVYTCQILVVLHAKHVVA